ncbi:MAG: hypothetical protein IIT68_00280 [Treponema sp.]|nr:hypothetical protein [Treponema sp.]
MAKEKKAKAKKLTSKQKLSKMFWGSFAPLITIVLIACTVFALVSGQIIRYYVRSETAYSSEKLVSKVMEQFTPAMVNIENYSNFTNLTSDESALRALTLTLSEPLTSARAIYYASSTPISQGGFFVDSSGWIPEPGWDATQRPWFKHAVSSHDRLVFEEPYVDDSTGDLTITMAKACRDTRGAICGVVAVDVNLAELTKLVNEIQLTKSCKAYVITKDGTYMTNPDSAKVMKGNYFDDTSLPAEYNSETYLTGEQKSYTIGKTYSAVSQLGTSPWFVVIEGNLVDYTGQFVNTVLIFEIILGVLSFIASAFNLRQILSMRKDERSLGQTLFSETQNLVVAAKETAATSQDQAAAAKEIVATMEDSTQLSENISSKIKGVSKVATKTSADVAEGVASIEKNIESLHAIFDANQRTIEGMKILDEKIENIWDIVTLINTVADQTKIIAFNAELEASTAGEAGKSFRIVANEIRRLSDNIIDGIREIKEKITEIQRSSDSLILASESGTEKINTGYQNAKEMGEKFESIRSSAEITASSADDITEIIQQQAIASEQILIAIKQISAGVENFAVATDNISSSAEHIRSLSENLNDEVNSEQKAADDYNNRKKKNKTEDSESSEKTE